MINLILVKAEINSYLMGLCCGEMSKSGTFTGRIVAVDWDKNYFWAIRYRNEMWGFPPCYYSHGAFCLKLLALISLGLVKTRPDMKSVITIQAIPQIVNYNDCY